MTSSNNFSAIESVFYPGNLAVSKLNSVNYLGELKPPAESESINILQLSELQPWNGIRKWLEKNLSYSNSINLSVEQLINPLSKYLYGDELLSELKKSHLFEDENTFANKRQTTVINFKEKLGGSFKTFCKNIEQCLEEHNIKFDPLELEEESKESTQLSKPIFDIIDATPLFYYADWRLGLVRLLRMLKPDGYIVFPYIKGDALLFDGQVAEWISEKGNRPPKNSPVNAQITMCWLFNEIEQVCNRPWVPELGLSKPQAMCQFLKHVLDYDLRKNEIFVTEFEDSDIHLKNFNYSNLFDFEPFNAFISPSEIDRLRDRLKDFLNIRKSKFRSETFHFERSWIAIKFPKNALNINKINDAAVLSLSSGQRYLIDSEHHLLPEFDKDKIGIESGELDEKILRSLRGFVCRMLQHDRFDPENHHLFIASLWNPYQDDKTKKIDFSQGKFSDVTGCVFRNNNRNEDLQDQALRNLAYFAHAQVNGITLQSIPQRIFDSDRPVMRVVFRNNDKWEFEIRGHSQLDYSTHCDQDIASHNRTPGDFRPVDIDSLLSAPKVPSEITFYVPHLDINGDKWKTFKEEYILQTGLLESPMPQFDTVNAGKNTLITQLLQEHWYTSVGSIHSFPWNLKKANKQPNGEGVGFIPRGLAAGLITKKLEQQFDDFQNKHSKNLWAKILLQDDDRYNEHLGKFHSMLAEFCRELYLDNMFPREQEEEHVKQWFNALLALTYVFPTYEEENESWELKQIPIGSFIDISHKNKSGKPEDVKKFVAAGSGLLISKLPLESQNASKDTVLRQELAEIRSSQLLRRVPSVLLPLWTLVLAEILKTETIKSVYEESRVEAARGLVHNLRNMISPAISGKSLIKTAVAETLRHELVDKVFPFIEEFPSWRDVEETEIASAFKDLRTVFYKFLEQVKVLSDRGNASELAIKDTLNAYYEFLSNEYNEKGVLTDILNKVINVTWEQWTDNSLEWFTTVDIENNEWEKTSSELAEVRESQRGKNKPWTLNSPFWLIENKAEIQFEVNFTETITVPFPAITFHIFLELIWNGIKHLAEEVVLKGINDEKYCIKIQASLSENKVHINYQQSLFDEKKVTWLREVFAGKTNDSRSRSFRGIRSIPVLAGKCGWKIETESMKDGISVEFSQTLETE